MKYRSVAISSLLLLGVGLSTSASATNVNSFAPFFTGLGVWYESDVNGGGQASIVSLAGQGGNLENNQPLPIGAARLTTGSDPTDKAEVGVLDAYGNARALFQDTFGLNYSYFKEPSGNAFAAPSIKLTLGGVIGCGSGDCFGTLVYEPTWNQPVAGSQPVPTGDWESVAITATSGLFWWTGGFSQPNTAGGPPLLTLTDWMDAFDGDFDAASLQALSVGLGSSNVDQGSYFDDVRISSTSVYNASYNFEPAVVPIPAAAWLFGSALLGLGALKRKKA